MVDVETTGDFIRTSEGLEVNDLVSETGRTICSIRTTEDFSFSGIDPFRDRNCCRLTHFYEAVCNSA